MKQIYAIIFALSMIVLPSLCAAQVCNDIVIPKSAISDDAKVLKIQSALDDYKQGGKYGICFKFEEPFAVKSNFMTKPFTLTIPSGETHDVYIDGLQLENHDANHITFPFLIIDNNGRGTVTLKITSITDVRNGLVLQGSGKIKIVESVISGDDSDGVCVAVNSYNAVIQGSDISHCKEGIRINASETLKGIPINAGEALIGAEDSDHADTDMNVIHNNEYGIHLIKGNHNKWAYNLIYDNVPKVGEPSAQNAIWIENDANEGLKPLEAILYQGEDDEDYAMRCERDEAGKVIKRELKFKLPPQKGEVSVFETSAANYEGNKQPKRYLTHCRLDKYGMCDLGTLPTDVMAKIKEGECGIDDFFITAIFTGTSSSELMHDPLPFDGYSSVILVGDDLPVSMPGATDTAIESGGDINITDDNITTDNEEEVVASSGGSSMGGEGIA
ncbi:MAG: NosD domain-containing protein, partial [Parcubacteria group bacterium]